MRNHLRSNRWSELNAQKTYGPLGKRAFGYIRERREARGEQGVRDARLAEANHVPVTVIACTAGTRLVKACAR